MPRQTVKIRKSAGQHIRAERLNSGWSQKDLAREARDVSTKWISRVENGEVNVVDPVYLHRVANALGVCPADLLADSASEHQPGELSSQSKQDKADAPWKDWALTHAAPALTAALDGSDPTKVLAAVAALKEIGTPAATQTIEAFGEQLLTLGHTLEQIRTNKKKPGPPIVIEKGLYIESNQKKRKGRSIIQLCASASFPENRCIEKKARYQTYHRLQTHCFPGSGRRSLSYPLGRPSQMLPTILTHPTHRPNYRRKSRRALLLFA